jgi:hypothetical protein
MTHIGSRSARGLLYAIAIGAMLAASPATALAANTGTQTTANLNDAKKHYGDGEKKFKAGDYAGALTEFQAADAIKATPQSQRYIGLCEDNLGHYAEAVSYYEKFLTAVPDKLKKEGEEIRTRMGVIKAMPARIHVETTPPGAAIVADGKAMGVTPTDVELAPGKHIVHIELAGYLAIDRDVDLSFGAKQEIKSELQAKAVETVTTTTTTTPPPVDTKPVEPFKPEPPKEKQSKLPAFITGGLAIVAIGIGTGFGIAALSTHSQFIATPTSNLADQGENFALVADMAFGVAITLGVTSAVLFLTNDDEPAAPAKSATAKKKPIKIIPTPFFTHNGGGAGAFLRF